MASPCGCPSNSNDPNAPTTPPEGTSHSYGSINCPSPDKPCYSSVCDDKFRALPNAKRLELIGVSGKCLYRIDTSQPGLLAVDPKGGVVISNAPNIDLQQLVNYATGPNGLLLDNEKNPIEGTPPEFPYLIIQLEDGQWRKVRGRPGSIGLLIWDEDGFHVRDIDDSNILISRPDGEAEQIEIIGFDTDDCLEEGERNNLVRLVRDIEGVAFFNPDTKKFTITSVCELFDDIGNLKGVPFLLACSDSAPVRFKGTNDAVLIWNETTGGFELIETDEKACDPTCGCATDLTLVYDCVTAKFSITDPNTHIKSWRSNSDAGPNVSIDFTLPWPALVTIYAGRRFIPTNGDLNVTRADIIVDGSAATSPSDGGLIARLDNATTNTGVAVIPLKKGGHNAYIGNTSTTGEDIIPIWSGAWMKIVAHRIKECDPVRPTLGAGTIRKAYGADAEECDCPPGPEGSPGATGDPGVPGPPGPLGSCPTGELSPWTRVDLAPADGSPPGTLQLTQFAEEITFEHDEDEETCEIVGITTDTIRDIGLVQAPIAPFSTFFVSNLGFIGVGEEAKLVITYTELVFDGANFSIQEGDIAQIPVPCSCSD